MTTIADDNTPNKLLVEQGSTPATPASGKQRLFIRTSDHKLCRVDSSGAVTVVEGASSSIPLSGWIDQTAVTWTRTGNYTFTISGDVTAVYRKGTKVRYKDGGSFEYGVVISSSYGAPNTTVTLATNSDYAMAAATITDNYYSHIENPEGWPEWFNYTPTYSGNGSMTFTSVSTTLARFRVSGRCVFVEISAAGTVGGTPNTGLQFTLPIEAALASSTVGLGAGSGVSNAITQITFALAIAGTPDICQVRLTSSGNWTAGSCTIRPVFFYEME